MEAGVFTWSNAVAGTVGNTISFTERMRIESTGLTTIKRTGITGVTKNDMTLQIGFEGNNGQNNLIGFGYNAGSAIPAYIGYTTTSGSSNTKGALVFGTRDVVTDSNPTERMRIHSNGTIGLGHSGTCGRFLHLKTGSFDGAIKLETTNTGTNYWAGVEMTTPNASSSIYVSSGDNSGTIKFNPGNSLKASLGTDLTCVGDVIAYSDKKLKENIKTLDGSKVYDMRGVSFTRTDLNKESSGVIAQEIQKIAPELINETEGTLGVAYGNLTGYLIEAIKELEARVKELENK